MCMLGEGEIGGAGRARVKGKVCAQIAHAPFNTWRDRVARVGHERGERAALSSDKPRKDFE